MSSPFAYPPAWKRFLIASCAICIKKTYRLAFVRPKGNHLCLPGSGNLNFLTAVGKTSKEGSADLEIRLTKPPKSL